MLDLVSIVVPIYNQEIYLDKSIKSLLNQSYHNIEIICVNDGSTDKSLEILNKYASRDQRIKIISEENAGLVQATITGIKEATGKYICFCDPDDYVGSEFISTFILNIKDADLIACGFYQDKNNQITPYRLRDNTYCSNKSLDDLRENFILDNEKMTLSNQVYVSRWNKMYRLSCIQEIIDDYGKCLNVSLGEDSIFTYLVLCHCNKVVTRSEPNAYFYNTSSQTSMMGNTEISKHLSKTRIAYFHFRDIEKKYGDIEHHQSTILYYFLIEAIFQRTKSNNKKEFLPLYKYLKQDAIYNNSLKYLICKCNGKDKLKLILRKIINNPNLYLKLSKIFS